MTWTKQEIEKMAQDYEARLHSEQPPDEEEFVEAAEVIIGLCKQIIDRDLAGDD